MIRRLRANLLDELQKHTSSPAGPRACRRAACWSSIRCACRSIRSSPTSADLLPEVISGSAIVSVVLSLPTTGPMLLRALQTQDMYLAGSFLMFLAFLTVVGVFISDLALAMLDPRIRLAPAG